MTGSEAGKMGESFGVSAASRHHLSGLVPRSVWHGRTGEVAFEFLYMDYLAPHFLDASAAVKLVLDEVGSGKLRAYFGRKRGGYWITDVCLVEALGVLKRNKKKLGLNSYLGRCFILISYIRNGGIRVVETELQNIPIWNETERIAKKYAKLDVSDALQIVTIQRHITRKSAEESKTILITADAGLAEAAREEGIRAWYCIAEDAPRQ